MRISPLLLAAGLALSGQAFAKLPPPTEEQMAKAAESKVKSEEAAVKAAAELTAAQDQVAARWTALAKARGLTATPTPIAPPLAK